MYELDALAAFALRLRDAGMAVGIGQVEAAARALAAVDASDHRAALRAVLCSRLEDLTIFDEVWAELAPPRPGPLASGLTLPKAPVPGPPGVAEDRTPGAGEEEEGRAAAWSAIELLRDRDFAELTDAERAMARVLVRQLARQGPTRPSRRLRPAARRAHAHRPDLQRTARAALRWGGEPVHRHWRAPGVTARPVVLVLDVSGSMAPYATALLLYAQAAVAAGRRVEVFAFGTRLTRITRELAGRDADAAIARAGEAVVDWAGGTRIAASLAALNREHGRRIGRGSVVVIMSDGWDRDAPEVLAAEMARLARTAHRLIWLNPLKAHSGYEPLARGMAAALPYVDHFLAGHSIRSLEELAGLLEQGMT